MQLALNDAQYHFQQEVRQFLSDELTSAITAAVQRTTTVWTEKDYMLAWQRKLLAKGWAVPNWPLDHGGCDWGPIEHYIFETECAKAGAPEITAMGLRMVGPVIIRFGTDWQKEYFLPRLLSGEDFWCQGFSEPGSGSDLASLRCRAERNGDHYIINGSKIWTTDAQDANRIFCLVRTDNSGRPQQGISFLLIDMDSPGLSVSPIHSVSGDHEVNQVFFDNVRVPVDRLVGEEGQGWTCAKYLLGFERGGALKAARLEVDLQHIEELIPLLQLNAEEREHWQAKIARLNIRLQALSFTEMRIIQQLAQQGGEPGPEASVLKIEFTEIQQKITELAVDVLGPLGLAHARLDSDQRETIPGIDATLSQKIAPLLPRYLNFRAASIYGGSNEIQRNIIAKTVLGLP